MSKLVELEKLAELKERKEKYRQKLSGKITFKTEAT